MKAISGVALGRIRMAHPGEEGGGFQRLSNSPHGESSNLEAGSNPCSSSEVRHVGLLQGGYHGDTEIHDGMET